MDDHISPFRFWVQPILPLSYDDSLSYLEVLLKVKIKLNEVISWANNYKDELYEYVDQKTAENLQTMQTQLAEYQNIINGRLNAQDSKISGLEGSINGILNNVNSLISQFQRDINRQIAQFQLDTNTQLREFNTQITNQINENETWVKAQIAAQNAYINAQLQGINAAIEKNLIDANKYTDEKIAEALAGLEPGVTDIIYPDGYQKMTIQEAINKLFYDLSFFSLTAQEYDNLTLTAQVYDDKELTAYQYDLYGKWYLIYSGNENNSITDFGIVTIPYHDDLKTIGSLRTIVPANPTNRSMIPNNAKIGNTYVTLASESVNTYDNDNAMVWVGRVEVTNIYGDPEEPSSLEYEIKVITVFKPFFIADSMLPLRASSLIITKYFYNFVNLNQTKTFVSNKTDAYYFPQYQLQQYDRLTLICVDNNATMWIGEVTVNSVSVSNGITTATLKITEKLVKFYSAVSEVPDNLCYAVRLAPTALTMDLFTEFTLRILFSQVDGFYSISGSFTLNSGATLNKIYQLMSDIPYQGPDTFIRKKGIIINSSNAESVDGNYSHYTDVIVEIALTSQSSSVGMHISYPDTFQFSDGTHIVYV